MTEAEEIIQQLKNFGNGAHAHTVNKCAYYIEVVENQTSEKVNLKGKRLTKQEWLNILCTMARKSMATSDWTELKNLMKTWW
jgi:hypothetical protein